MIRAFGQKNRGQQMRAKVPSTLVERAYLLEGEYVGWWWRAAYQEGCHYHHKAQGIQRNGGWFEEKNIGPPDIEYILNGVSQVGNWLL